MKPRKQIKKFNMRVTRTEIATVNIEVEAFDEDEAVDVAIEKARENIDFSDKVDDVLFESEVI